MKRNGYPMDIIHASRNGQIGLMALQRIPIDIEPKWWPWSSLKTWTSSLANPYQTLISNEGDQLIHPPFRVVAIYLQAALIENSTLQKEDPISFSFMYKVCTEPRYFHCCIGSASINISLSKNSLNENVFHWVYRNCFEKQQIFWKDWIAESQNRRAIEPKGRTEKSEPNTRKSKELLWKMPYRFALG